MNDKEFGFGRRGRTARAGGLAAALLLGAAGLPAAPQPAAADESATAPDAPATDATLLGTMGGLRPFLARGGVSLGLSETSEAFSDVGGGAHRGTEYDGVTMLTLGVDTEKAFGLAGGTFNASVLQIHGRNLSADDLYSLQTASGLQADPGTRLWELWYQQALAGDRLDVKLGQQSVDQEFLVSQYAALFVGTQFGWPTVTSSDLPSGGPAYPLSSLGVRLRGKPTDNVTALFGVFDDNPAGPGTSDPQHRDHAGTNFRVSDSALAIGEIQLARPAAEKDAPAAVYKAGAWFDGGSFADQRMGTDGLSLADPASNGIAQQHRGDWGFYAVADQPVWHGGASDPRAVAVFLRVVDAPQEDRNPVDLSITAGLTVKAPIPGRPDDTFGIGGGYAHIGAAARGFDQDTIRLQNPSYVVRSGETFLEATYQLQLTPWWQVQPDLQHTIRPGGGIADPENPGQRLGDETVVGLRTTITF